ncbi:glycosyltransferase family 2 protein [Desulforamulus hydrothermalis]|uniref:Putative Glycosyl transferase, family 2 n=1 Tax=Desulforamulus hydrothermalis Lam5 = DSM 18033 TaxID=1121428 RepID=K8EBL0_9FIRM|nr:glycosyltransferase family 2 protein [Desulforamulus hydrothermalis]CCO09053.1 putative Glycosyl transferase, family 2 [Desulforamulus hydrothermalis Lam5 = DSM 18033]SHG77966.1 Glycosyltransferase involved in cell wall bisynthesis [Desulforamulus hydrothermalis Lam5 = DSM 18033]
MSTSCTISLCMIVKNEANYLDDCLSRVKDLVDEIIVVDTGSSDDTIKIARNYHAKIFSYDWAGDFSKARNYSLDQASGDWIIYLDADEELLLNEKSTLHNLINQTATDGYYFVIISPTDDNPASQQLRSSSLRLFRNHPLYRFQGAIHEQIIPAILAHKPDAKLVKTDIAILHHGYKNTNIENKNKCMRNLEIARQQVEQYPGNNFYRYNLGVALYQINDLKGALTEWQKVIETLDYTAGYAPNLLRNYIICLILTMQHKKALQTAEKAIRLYHDYTDLYYLKGQALEKSKEFLLAEEAYKHCLVLGEAPSHYVSTIGLGSYFPLGRLANLMETCQRYEEAVMYYCQAFKCQPAQQEFLTHLLRNLSHVYNDPAEIRSYIENNLPSLNDDHLLQIATILHQLGDFAGSLAFLEKCNRLSDQMVLLKCNNLIKLGNWDKAKNLILEINHAGSVFCEAVLDICICNWSKDNPVDAQIFIEKLTDIDRYLYLTLLNFNNKLVKGLNTFTHVHPASLSKLILKLVEHGNTRLAQEAVNWSGRLNTGEIHFNLGKILFQHNKILEAADQLLQAMQAGFSNDELYFMLGCICQQRNILWEAEQLVQQAIAMAPAKQTYHEKLVEILLSQTGVTLAEAITKFPHRQVFKYMLDIVNECQQQLNAAGCLD